MSHTVTVTRTTTTTSTSAIILNTGYLKTWPGILKLAELVLGIIVVGILGYYYGRSVNIYYYSVAELFYFLMAVTFMIGTALILISCLASLSTGSIMQKTIYELVYHGFAFLLYLAASVTFIIDVSGKQSRAYRYHYEPYMAAAVIGLILTVLYLLSTIFAHRSYRGL